MVAATETKRRRRSRFNWNRVLLFVVLAFFLFWVLLPFYWMIRTSMMTFGEITRFPPEFFPSSLRLVAYDQLLHRETFVLGIRNSFLVSIATVLLTLIFSVLGSYAVARLRFRGKGLFMRSIVIVYMFPSVLLMIPLFVIFSRLRLDDNLAGLVIIYLGQTIPVATYMLSSYFRTVPDEIEEAAIVDGCTRWTVIPRITLPLSIPAIASIAIYTFMIAWNEYLFAFIMLKSGENLTLPIAFYRLFGAFNTAWDMVMAAAAFISLPVIAIFLLFEKQLAAGLTAGAVKG